MNKAKGPQQPSKVRDVTAEYLVTPTTPALAELGRTVNIRDLKAHASEILRELEQSGEEAVITRRGAPWGRIVPFPQRGPTPGPKRVLRNRYRDLPELSEEDFQEAKGLWREPADDAGRTGADGEKASAP